MDKGREEKQRHLFKAKVMGLITVSKGRRNAGGKKKQKTKPQNQDRLLVFSGKILPEWLPDGWPALVKSCFTLHFIN